MSRKKVWKLCFKTVTIEKCSIWYGLSFQGIRVVSVIVDSPADHAGLAPGDFVLHADELGTPLVDLLDGADFSFVA